MMRRMVAQPMSIRDEIRVPKLVRLYDFWESKLNGRRYPSRDDIDPLELKFILGNIDLVEVAGDPVVFLFRLSGSENDRDEGITIPANALHEHRPPEHRDARHT